MNSFNFHKNMFGTFLYNFRPTQFCSSFCYNTAVYKKLWNDFHFSNLYINCPILSLCGLSGFWFLFDPFQLYMHIFKVYSAITYHKHEWHKVIKYLKVTNPLMIWIYIFVFCILFSRFGNSISTDWIEKFLNILFISKHFSVVNFGRDLYFIP